MCKLAKRKKNKDTHEDTCCCGEECTCQESCEEDCCCGDEEITVIEYTGEIVEDETEEKDEVAVAEEAEK